MTATLTPLASDDEATVSDATNMNAASDAIEAAAFRRLVQHLRERTDVQNLDLMNLAGFCRNCLSKWYRTAAEERGVAITDAAAREHIYGMPYDAWKAAHQK